MFKKTLSNLIIVSLLLTMMVPNFALASGSNSLADDFAAKSNTQIVKKNIYNQDLLDICYYSNNSSFYAVGNNGTMLVSNDGDNWSPVTDLAVSSSTNVNFVDVYCTSNQIAVVGQEVGTGNNYILLKDNNDVFVKQNLSTHGSGNHTVQAVAISGTNIAVTTNTSSYYHSVNSGESWDFSVLNSSSTGASAIAVDTYVSSVGYGKFKVYNNSDDNKRTFDSLIGLGTWTSGGSPDRKFSTIKNMYRSNSEWVILTSNGTSASEMFYHNMIGGSNAVYPGTYMMEAAYVLGDGTKIIVGWVDDKMIIRSYMEPDAHLQSSPLSKLHQYTASDHTNSWVGTGKLYGIDAGLVSGQKVYIAVGSNGSILKSTNGYQFAPVAARIKHLIANDDPNGSTPGQQVAITEDNRVYYSNDRGVTWTYAYKVALSGEVAAMQFLPIGIHQRLYIATNNAVSGTATSYQMLLPNLEYATPLDDFTIRGVTTNTIATDTKGIVYYGTTPSNGFAKIVSHNNNGGFVQSGSTAVGDIQLMLDYGTQLPGKFAFIGNITHVVSIPYGSYTYNIPGANGNGSNGAISKTYVAWAKGNEREILMDASGYVRVFKDPDQYGSSYGDTLIFTGQGVPSSASFQLSKLVFVKGLYAALGKDGSIYTSFDGIIWTLQTDLSSANIVDIAIYNNNSLLLLNNNNTVHVVALTNNAWTNNTYVKYPDPTIAAPQGSGPYDGTQAGVNVITVDTANDPNLAGATPSYKWFVEDTNGVPQELTGKTLNTLDLSELSAGTNRVHVEVTYSDATKADQPQSTRRYGSYNYSIFIPQYEVDVAYSATSFTAVEGYEASSVTPITVTIENTGNTPITDLQISSSNTSVVVASALSSSTVAVEGTVTGQLTIAANQLLGSYPADITVSSATGNILETKRINVNITDAPRFELNGQVNQNQIQLAHDYASMNDAKVALTLNNTGNRDIEALTVTLSDTQNFELSSVPARIEMGDTATIEITPKVMFQPGSTYNYQLTINSEATVITKSVAITVDETPRYEVTLTPVKTSVAISDDYTNVSSGEMLVTIENTGNRDLNDLAVALQGADASSFTLNAVSPNLPVGQNVSVIATPIANLPINEYSATLTVTSATYSITKNEALRLTVTDVPVYNMNHSLDTNSLNLAHGYTTNDGIITITLRNDGNRDETPAVSVSDPSVLAVGTIPASIAANTSGSFDVNVIENVAAGTYPVILSVTSAAGTTTETITVNIQPAPLYQLNITADRYNANLAHNYADASAGKFVVTALNDGNQDLQNISIVASDIVNFTLGTIPSQLTVGDQVIVEVTPIAGLTAGSYPVTVTFRADQMTDQVVTLTVVVASAQVRNPDPSPSPTSVDLQPIVTTNGQITIPAGTSGTTSYNDVVTLQIPANASAQALKITIEQLLDVSGLNQNGEEFASPVYEILKSVSDNFSIPVTLNFKFDPSLVNEGQYAAIFYYDEAKEEWIEIGGEVNGDQIEAQVDHFTKFTVLVMDKKTESASAFNDVAGHWAADKIAIAVEVGFVKGYPDHTFGPNDTATREQFAVMLTQALSMANEGSSMTFTDSDLIGAWAKPAVASAVKAGVITGYVGGSFAPKASITRTELSVMIARAAGIDLSASVVTSFTDDSSIPEWGKTAVASLQALGIISGKVNGQFEPQATATRAEAVTIILNLLNHLSK